MLHYRRVAAVWAMLTLAACSNSNTNVGPNGPEPDPALEPALTYSTGLNLPKDHDLGVLHMSLHQLPTGLQGAVGDDVPDSWDWREHDGVTPIKNQGQCGSCWAFGSAAVLESSMKIFGNKVLSLAEQEIVDCDRQANGCGGGFFAGDFMQQVGLTDSDSYPYRARNGRCNKANVKPVAKPLSWGYVGSRGHVASMDEMAAAIKKYGPVAVTVSATGYWMRYKGGVFKSCVGRMTNHIVTAVAYNKTSGTIVIKNSWGEQWGDKGYMELPLGCDNVGQIANFVVTETTPCKPPTTRLPIRMDVHPGDAAYLAVKPEEHVSYEWFDGNTSLGDGKPALEVTPKGETIYKLVAKNACGTAESSVRVVVAD